MPRRHHRRSVDGTVSAPHNDASPSPSQRYQTFRRNQERRKSVAEQFARTLPFELDEFQRQANEALEADRNVLVAAPTGAGKTIVADFAIYLAQQRNVKAFYTTPIKALSNQKYHDLVAVYGADRVGLLTGDTSINSEADIVVMTTEVLRNMLYERSSTLTALRYVILDEVHYLADRFRGPVSRAGSPRCAARPRWSSPSTGPCRWSSMCSCRPMIGPSRSSSTCTVMTPMAARPPR